MVITTATQASRRFSAMLDAVERGERFLVVRDGKRLAEVIPFRARTLGGLADALTGFPADPQWADQVDEVLESESSSVWESPWGDS